MENKEQTIEPRLTDHAEGYCEKYCENYGIPGCWPETCVRKNEAAMYEKLKRIEGIVPFDRLIELAQADREHRCAVLLARPRLKNCSDNEVYLIVCGNELAKKGEMNEAEIMEDHVLEVSVGENSEGEDACIYETDGNFTFSSSDIGRTVFRTYGKAQAALERYRSPEASS